MAKLEHSIIDAWEAQRKKKQRRPLEKKGISWGRQNVLFGLFHGFSTRELQAMAARNLNYKDRMLLLHTLQEKEMDFRSRDFLRMVQDELFLRAVTPHRAR